jgi:hypothetical protein
MIRWTKRTRQCPDPSKQPASARKRPARLGVELLEDRLTPSNTLAAPKLLAPVTPVRVDQDFYSIRGALPTAVTHNTIVYAYRDINGNGHFDSGRDSYAASTVLTKGHATFVLSVRLRQNATNEFVVFSAENSHRLSPAVQVPRITEDSRPPAVVSISLLGQPVTNAASLSFLVRFSEPVTGVDPSDFQVVRSGSVTGGTVSVVGSGAFYVVTVNGLNGTGSVGLNLVDDDTIRDILTIRSQSHPLGGIGAGNGNFTGAVYTLDQTAPTVASISGVTSAATTGGTAVFQVTFSEPVTGVDASDFLLSGGAAGGAVL